MSDEKKYQIELSKEQLEVLFMCLGMAMGVAATRGDMEELARAVSALTAHCQKTYRETQIHPH